LNKLTDRSQVVKIGAKKMAKYSVTHSCGHTQEHRLFGKHSGFGGRDSKLEWLETQPCSECWKRKIKEENERSAALAHSNNLSPLSGSEKQIQWATSIRQQMIDSLETFIKDCGNAEQWAAKVSALREAFGLRPGTADWYEKVSALREAFRVIVLSNTDSRWFIDNRGFGTVRVAFGKQLVDWVKSNRPEVLNAEDKKAAE
jgi:hypothetical protein